MNYIQIQKILQISIIILFLLLVQAASLQCMIGCNKCDSYNKCIECMENYSLLKDKGQCNYDLCEEQLFYQVKQDKKFEQSNNCQSICDHGFWKSSITNLCEPLYICSQQYSYNPAVSVEESIKQVVDYQSNFFIVIQQTKVNLINKLKGRLEIQLPLDSNTIQTQYYEGYFFLFKDDNTISKWSINNSGTELFNNKIGQFNQFTRMIKFNSNFLYLYQEENKNNTLILRKLYNISTNTMQVQDKPLIIQLENGYQKQLFEKYLFISNGKGIKVLNFVETDQLNVNNFTSSFLCTDFWFFEISQIIQPFEKNSFYIISKLSQIVALISSESCIQMIYLEELPKYITSAIINQFKFIIVNLQTNVSIFDQKQTLISKLAYNNYNLIDSILINLSQDQFLIASLFNNKVIIFYKFNFSNNKFEQIYLCNLNIQFIPIKINMISIQQSQEQIQSFQILVYKSEIYQLFVQLKDNGIVVNDQNYITQYTRRDEDIKSAIASIDYNIDNDLISICSKSGKVITWDSSQIFNSMLFDLVNLGNLGQCKNLKYINDNQVLIIFDSQIINFNVLTQKIEKTWLYENKLSKQVNKFSEKQGDYLMLLFDSCLFIYNLLNEKIAQNCSQVFDDSINSVFFEISSYNIIIQKSTSIYVFYFNLNDKSITQKSFIILQTYKIQQMKVRTFSQEYKDEKKILFEIAIYNDNLSLIIFDESLNILYTFSNIPLGTALDIQYADQDSYDKFYFVLGVSIYKSANFLYQVFAMPKGGDKFYQSVLSSSGLLLTNVTKKTNNINSNLVDYEFKICMQISNIYVCQAYTWNISKVEAIVRDLQLYQPQLYSSFIVSKNKQYYILGDLNGQVGINYNKQQFDNCVFSTTKDEFQSKDYIKEVQQSFKLGKYFVIKSNIYIFNLFTNEFIEKIEVFQSTAPIQKFNLLNEKQSFICLKNNILFLKNLSTKIVLTYKKMEIINNFLIQQDNIYVFGSQISILDFQLTQIVVTQKFVGDQVQNCQLAAKYLICKMTSGYIYYYSQNSLELQNSFFSQNLDSSFLMLIDSANEHVFLYTQTVEVYSFAGNLIQIITQANGKINEMQLFEDIVAYRTNGFLTILDRVNFVERGVITSPGGGIIQKIFFIKEYNHVIMNTSNMRFGQLFTFSLQTFLNVMTFKNGYTQNEPSLVVDIGFDREQNFILYLDQTGNFQQILYSTFVSQSQLKLADYSTSSNSIPVGFSVDFNSNNLIIYSQTQVFSIAYGEVAGQITMVKMEKNFQFVEIKDISNLLDDAEEDLDKITFIIIGDNGILHKYYNTHLEYYFHFDESVLQVYYSNVTKNLIIALSKKIVVFKNITSKSIQNQSGWFEKREEIEILRSTFVKFLCDDIFLTRDFSIFHYDFENKIQLYKFQLEQNNRITSYYFSNSSNILAIGINNGDLILYNLDKKEDKKYDLLQKNPNTIIKRFSIGFISETQSEMWVCLSSYKGIYKINKKSSQIQEILLFDNVQNFIQIKDLKVGLFFVDDQYSRFFLSFVTENIVRVYDFKINGELQLDYLMLPKRQHNRIKISDQIIIFSSSSQLMIYNRLTLKFINKIRRLNGFDQINSITIILNKYIIICFDLKYELFSIPSYSSEEIKDVKLLDQKTLSDPIIMKYKLVKYSNSFLLNNSNELKLQVIALAKQKVIEQRYNLAYEEQVTENKKCEIDIQVQSYIQMIQSIQNIKPQTYSDPTMRQILTYPYSNQNSFWMIILESGNLLQVNFKGTKDSIVAIYSSSQTNSQSDGVHELFINLDTFQSYSKDQINIRDYSFKFQFVEGSIFFSQITKIVNLHNIFIKQQEINSIQILFKNMKRIVIKGLQFNSVSLNTKSKQPFLIFEDCEEVFIYDLVIQNNLKYQLTFRNLLTANNVKKFIIQNISINNVQIDELFIINFTKLLILKNVSIQNSQRSSIKSENLSQGSLSYIFLFAGIQSTTLDEFQIKDCENLQLISSKKDYINSNTFIKLLADTLDLTNFVIQNNKLNQNQTHLILIQNSYINIKNIQYYGNEGNISIENSLKILINDGEFQSNKSLNGGALEFSYCLEEINIDRCYFQNNQAKASGGAIYIEEFYGKILININTTQIKQNTALIGGGMRISNFKSDIPNSFWKDINNIFKDNDAELYGKNFTSFLNQIKIQYYYQQDLKNQEDEIDLIKPDFQYIEFQNLTKEDQELYYAIALLSQFKSGGQVRLGITLTDSEGQSFNFSQSKIENQEYPESIISEIKSLYLKIEQIDQSNVFINGQNIIGYKGYQQEQNIFLFKELHVTSIPNSKQNLLIYYQISPQTLIRKPILFQIEFRVCLIGEILKEITTNTFSCYQCPLGSYSVEDPTKDKYWMKYILKQDVEDYNQVDKKECQKCPDSANECQSNEIQLKNGFWRSSNISTDIVECDYKIRSCIPEDPSSRGGCEIGYTGPACSECDFIGKIWDNVRYARSYTNTCQECSSINYQILFIALTILIMITYFIFSSILFMNNFMHSSICQYLRYLKILPISRNSIRDQSSFYLKILINYIQISSVLISFQMSFLPEIITFIPNFVGQPGSKIIVSLDCIISKHSIKQYGHIHLIQFISAIIPFFFCIITLTLINIFETLKLFTIKKYHKYTLLNFLFVFFQPDQISFFSKQLTCKKIGSNYYISSDYTIDCDDKSYAYFSYIISIPLLLFWSSLPLVILFKLRKISQSLNTCLTRYKFGYYYSEFKSQFYYWEFIRILLRVIIVVLTTLMYK